MCAVGSKIFVFRSDISKDTTETYCQACVLSFNNVSTVMYKAKPDVKPENFLHSGSLAHHSFLNCSSDTRKNEHEGRLCWCCLGFTELGYSRFVLS